MLRFRSVRPLRPCVARAFRGHCQLAAWEAKRDNAEHYLLPHISLSQMLAPRAHRNRTELPESVKDWHAFASTDLEIAYEGIHSL